MFDVFICRVGICYIIGYYALIRLIYFIRKTDRKKERKKELA